jgi:branched-chain amino acid transport system substrate-binding protein
MGGRTVELIRLDDESDLTKAPSNVNRLPGRDQIDALIGTVSPSGVILLWRAARYQQVPLIGPGAGNVAPAGEQCAPSMFRPSCGDWQPGFGIGTALAANRVKKAAGVTWNFPAGRDEAEGFADGPRGEFAVPASHNPVQTIWPREAKNGENRVIGTAAEALADPGTGCTMG